jgi:hypothetical protein
LVQASNDTVLYLPDYKICFLKEEEEEEEEKKGGSYLKIKQDK